MTARTCTCRSCPTRGFCLGAELGANGLQALETCIQPCPAQHKGESLYRAGDRPSGCYITRSGFYMTVCVDPGGAEYVMGFHYPGEIFGLAGLSNAPHQESVIALETSTACRVAPENFPDLWEIGGGPALLRLIGDHEQRVTTARIILSQRRAEHRVARFLAELAERMRTLGRDPQMLPLPMSRTYLANHLGMTLESLSRTMSALGRRGVIRASRSEVQLRDPQLIAMLAAMPSGQ